MVEIQEGWELKWFGCMCSEEERGSCFEVGGDYTRACSKCSVELKGQWYCEDCGFQPEEVIVKTSRDKKFKIQMCPECGRMLE